jgi:hypothetical protein
MMQEIRDPALPPPEQEDRYVRPTKRDANKVIGGEACGQRMNGHAANSWRKMFDLNGKLIPDFATAVVVGNSEAGTIALKKRSLSPARPSSLKKLQRAMNVAGAAPADFISGGAAGRHMEEVRNRHVHPRHKRVAAE